MSKKNTQKRRSFMGIDVSKKLLEVGVHQSDYHFSCPNDPKHFPALIAELISLHQRIVLEATGGLERALPALHAVGLPVVVVNPRRDFAKLLGQLPRPIGLMRAHLRRRSTARSLR
jgi:transposase